MAFMDSAFWSNLFSGFLVLAALFILAVFIWHYNRKNLWHYQRYSDGHDTAIKNAAWGLLIYSASFPLMYLMFIGASMLVAIKPSWNLSLSLTLIAVNISFMFYVVLFPLARLCISTVFLWAAEINLYMQKEYPLEYYEPKVAFLKK
jgi:magnesium-transporting ATPase (P-type)